MEHDDRPADRTAELDALQTTLAALMPLSPTARQRVLSYIRDKVEEEDGT